MNIRRTLLAAGLAGGLLAAPLAVSAGDGNPLVTYRVTIENTADGFQPLSPAGVVVHHPTVDVWSSGAPASAAVAAVAEDANLPVFVGTYEQLSGVAQAFVGGAAPFGPGDHVMFEFEARPGQRLSLVSMLVNTNDAFTGLDSVVLTGASQVIELGVYDAGTEVNNESGAYIPGPVGGNPMVRDPEGALVMPHPGIVGGADLDPVVHGWGDIAAVVTIERVG